MRYLIPFLLLIISIAPACGDLNIDTTSTSNTRDGTDGDGLRRPGTWDMYYRSDSADKLFFRYRGSDKGTGEWCSHAGSYLLVRDLNEDGIIDYFCRDVRGNEEVINGQRQLYGYPALRARTTTYCVQFPWQGLSENQFVYTNLIPITLRIGASDRRFFFKCGKHLRDFDKGKTHNDYYTNAHDYLKPLF